MSIAALAETAKAWPFEQARELKARIDKLEAAGRPKDAPVVFETGYGPSGLPHIGTFGEVVRTTMVRKAFEALTDGRYKTRIICVSDDMDGMRKIPDTVPNPGALKEYLQKPLTSVPDPFGTHESYGAHMNARLRAFLDSFGFEYEFASATTLYRTGVYDAMLLRAAERFDKIMDVMLPTLGDERRETYSIFLPISPTTGRVLYVQTKVDAKAGTVTFQDEDGSEATLPVTGGHVKLQWKPDFGMRWAALGVDFEMFGKDHQANAPVYSKICRVLGAEPPQQYVYELFLDDKGEKISKTKGNGISVEQWLSYAPDESLALYMWQKPRTAKKLYFDVIPKAVDEYVTFLEKFAGEAPAAQVENPVWAIHGGKPPAAGSPVSFALLLNLVSAANASTKDVLWGFIRRQAPDATPEKYPLLDRMVGYALAYYADFVKPAKVYRAPTDKEREALADLAGRLEAYDGPLDGEALQTLIFAVGTERQFEPLRDWFKAIYEVLLGQSQGPRFGSFVALYGVKETAKLIREGLAGKVG
jgi:lysyl-tRNA synthetase class 1